MSTGILTVTKSLDGQEWANTYGISVGSTPGPLSQEDLGVIIATNPSGGFNEANTNPQAGGYVGSTSIIAAIVGMEREIHYSAVSFVRLNLNDGTTPGTGTGEFWSASINVSGMRDAGAGVPEVQIAPLNVALLVNRSGSGLSVKPGRLYYRAVMLDVNIKPGSRVGVTWQDPASKVALIDALTSAMNDAQIDNYLSIDTVPNIHLSIVQASQADGSEGVIIDGRPVASLSVNKPVSRQLTRGRRRRAIA